MAKSATPSGLFVRQASGLVRDVSMANALFFNISAFVGTSVGWAVVFYALFPEWQGLGISAYAWMALLTGIACFFLGLIFASLTTAMPRSGGDYVFTSRIIGPFWGWLESWTLVGSALTIFAIVSVVISFFGAFSIDPSSMNAALPKLGTSSQAIMTAATKAGYSL